MADPDFTNTTHPDRVLIAQLDAAIATIDAIVVDMPFTTLALAQAAPLGSNGDTRLLKDMLLNLNSIKARAHRFDRSV